MIAMARVGVNLSANLLLIAYRDGACRCQSEREAARGTDADAEAKSEKANVFRFILRDNLCWQYRDF